MALPLHAEKRKAQEEMRRLMLERKNKDKKPKQIINNPLAKYNNIGQLMCVLCSSIVRSENVWEVHINSKQHRNNVDQAKKLKQLTNNFTDDKVKKRLATTTLDTPQEKKPKGILKNSVEKPPVVQKPKNNAPIIFSHHDEQVVRKDISSTRQGEKLEEKAVEKKVESNTQEIVPDPSLTQPIPEGFFDDPILDAKARNIEYKDPVEEEWEKFQKEIKEETTTSAEIIAGEQEEATAERQIDEIDEQIRNWSRVLDLELKKEETKKKIQDIEMLNEDDDNDSDNEAEIDEFLDWRAKKSYS
ncbi:zinc finger protein 830 [Bicyclus anynana]|uniref:Zinc finger protein 830 n=1 Tax=Bicyclus anynana TaxID=110368 RepID=A0A6J1MLL6_BICAN|nr:zinc finger protein 830 [Bicyclus anynana]